MNEELIDYILDRAIYFMFGMSVGILIIFYKLIQAFIVLMEAYNIPIDITL